jgi:hypothetical protein
MRDANQGPGEPDPPPGPPDAPPAWPDASADRTAASEFGPTTTVPGWPAPHPRERAPDLRFWLLAVAALGIGGLLTGQTELASLSLLAGLFAVAHAADLDPSRRYAYYALAWVVPFTAVACFAGLASVLLRSPMAPVPRALGVGFAALGAMATLITAPPPGGGILARALFRVPIPSHAIRLAGRLALLGVMFYPVASIAFPSLLDSLAQSGTSLLGRGSLWGNLGGLILLALGGVGFRVRRDLAATLERLGLRWIEPSQWAIVGAGVLGLVLVNAGAEWVQRTWFPALWAADQHVNQVIASGLSRSDALLLGLSAGVGEEIALRGALQPRLGVFMTSAVFAVLHVQYSWFGAVIILLLGLVLGTIRQRTSTTAAMLVHALYDLFAVLALRS